MPPLAYGLTLPSKPNHSHRHRAAPSKHKPLLDDDPDSDDDGRKDGFGELEPIQVVDDAQPTEPSPVRSVCLTDKEVPLSLRAEQKFHNLAGKHTAAAQAVDPTSYEYDAVYDSLHPAKLARNDDSTPKYMHQLLRAAEVRKRDQLRAKDATLLREREAEGQEFADKEQFVTAAYKAQQEEVQRLEEEEEAKARADAERTRQGGGGMTSFYKSLIEREEARHQAAIGAMARSSERLQQSPQPPSKSDAELAQEAGVQVNEEGQVVDKRQTLQAGLNLKTKPDSRPTTTASGRTFKHSASMAVLSGHRDSKHSMRERQSRMLEAQLESMAKRAADNVEVEEEAARRSAKSKKSAADVQSARARYLQRKKDAASERP